MLNKHDLVYGSGGRQADGWVKFAVSSVRVCVFVISFSLVLACTYVCVSVYFLVCFAGVLTNIMESINGNYAIVDKTTYYFFLLHIMKKKQEIFFFL